MTEQPDCRNSPVAPKSRHDENPHDKLMMAIGILQAHYLASDTNLVPDRIFGSFYFSTTGVEHAINMLIDLLPALDEVTP